MYVCVRVCARARARACECAHKTMTNITLQCTHAVNVMYARGLMFKGTDTTSKCTHGFMF